MLQAIRGKTASIVAKALALLLIVAFAAWGVEDFIGARATETHVATVGDRDIDPQAFEYELSLETQRLRRAFGGALTDEQMLGLGIGNAVLQRMINDVALDIQAADLGLLISDDLVVEAIQRDPTFQGFDGRFSRQRFDEIMRRLGLTEAGYIQEMRSKIAANQLLQAFGGTGAAPNKLADLIREQRYARRSAQLIAVKTADQPDPGQPTDAALSEIYQAQPERFTAPEYRKFTFVHLDTEQLLEGVQVDDATLQATYEANAAQFIQPETRTIQQMVFNDKESAETAKAQLAEGRAFEDVAVDVAKMEKEAVELGTVGRDGLLPALADAAFALDEGAVSEPVETPLGWHLLKAKEIQAGVTKTLDDVRDEVRKIAAREKAVEALYDLSIRFEDAIGGGATLEEAASSVGVNVVTIDSVDRSGMTPNGKEAALPQLASLLPVAFSTDQGVESPLTEAGDKGYFMVRVDSVTPPALKPLDAVRSEVTEVWREQEREKAAEAAAKALAERAKSGARMADLSETVETVGPVTRHQTNGADRTVVTRMFEIDQGSAGIAKVEDGYRVVYVTEALGPANEGVPTKEEIAKELDLSVGNDIGEQMLYAMRRDYGVEVNQRVYNAVLKPGQYDPSRPGG